MALESGGTRKTGRQTDSAGSSSLPADSLCTAASNTLISQSVKTEEERMGEPAIFVGCPFRPAGVDQKFCDEQCSIPAKNISVCCEAKCKSPWRRCKACVLQRVSVRGEKINADTGLCRWHTEKGVDAIRTVLNIAAVSRRSMVSATDMKMSIAGSKMFGSNGANKSSINKPPRVHGWSNAEEKDQFLKRAAEFLRKCSWKPTAANLSMVASAVSNGRISEHAFTTFVSMKLGSRAKEKLGVTNGHGKQFPRITRELADALVQGKEIEGPPSSYEKSGPNSTTVLKSAPMSHEEKLKLVDSAVNALDGTEWRKTNRNISIVCSVICAVKQASMESFIPTVDEKRRKKWGIVSGLRGSNAYPKISTKEAKMLVSKLSSIENE